MASPWINPAALSTRPMIPPGGMAPPAAISPVRSMSVPQGTMPNPAFPAVSDLTGSDPALQAELSRLNAMAQQGALNPTLLNPGVPPGAMNLPAETEGASITGLLSTGILAGLIGYGLGEGMNRFMQGIQSPNSLILKFLHGLESLPGVAQLNRKLLEMSHQQQTGRTFPWVRRLLQEDSEEILSHQQLQAYMGPKGAFAEELKKLNLPVSVRNAFQQVKNSRELLQLLENSPLHLVSKEEVGEPVYNLLQKGFTKPRFPFLSKTPAESGMTLAQLDRLIEKKHLLNIIEEATQHADPAKRFSYNLYEKIVQALEKPVSGLTPMQPGTQYVRNLTTVLTDSTMGPPLKDLLGLTSDTSYSAIQSQLAKTPVKTLTQVLEQNTQSLLTKPLSNPSQKNLTQVLNHYKRFHISQSPAFQSTWIKLNQLLKGVVKTTQSFENNYLPIFREEQKLHRMIKTGPVGKIATKLLYSLQRMFNGASLKSFISHGGQSSMLGRFSIILAIGLSISEAQRSSKETRISKMAHNVSSVIASFFGWELGRMLVQELGVLSQNSAVARRTAAMINPKLPWAWAQPLSQLILPSILGSLFSFGSDRILDLAFGDPRKLEQKAAFEADKQRQLNSQHGLLDSINKGDFSKLQAKFPNLLPTPSIPETPETPLNPESVGLTPEVIAQNPLDAEYQHDLLLNSGLTPSHLMNDIWSYGSPH